MKKFKNRSIFTFLIIVFTNVISMWIGAFKGQTPYGSYEKFQTKNKEFEYSMVLDKFMNKEEEFLKMENEFIEFKKQKPEYSNLMLYRTNHFNEVQFWTFWKWYRYMKSGPFLDYPYLEVKD